MIFFATKNLKHTKVVPQRAFGKWFMKEIAVSNYKSAINEKKHKLPEKNDIAFFASEKLKNNFLNLSQKIYIKVKFLFEWNTSVGLKINFILVEHLM